MNTFVYHALRRLGWGLVIVLIDFRIVSFDLLPDFIGYIMIAAALRKLSFQHSDFQKAMWFAIAMIFLSLPDAVTISNFDISDFSILPLKLHLFGQAILGLHILMAFWIFNGLNVMADQAGDNVLVESIRLRRNSYMVVSISQLIYYPFLLNIDDSWRMLFIVLIVLSFIMELLFLRLPFRLSKAISDSKGSL